MIIPFKAQSYTPSDDGGMVVFEQPALGSIKYRNRLPAAWM